MSRVNLNYYIGRDLYSDGDVENDIFDIVNANYEYTNVIRSDVRWPILYHLSGIRRNILEWYEFEPESSLLEIGAGCGALTGLFCERVRSVVAVESSLRRGRIIDARYKTKGNLDIIVGNFMDLQLTDRFDYITLIGVLEYAESFIDAENPATELLQSIRDVLNPGGTLFLAIENKFGLKYWSGAKEDHTGKLFSGIEGYPSMKTSMTYAKGDLVSMLQNAGFDTQKFYYPVPDYKLPTQIFSDNYLPTVGQIEKYYSYDRDRYELFNEMLAVDSIIRSNMFSLFSNSFLVLCQ